MNFTRSLGILNTLRVTPGEIKKETRKKFILGLAGSPDFVASFYEVLTSGMPLDCATGILYRVEDEGSVFTSEKPIGGFTPCEKYEPRDFFEILTLPIDEATRRQMRTDATIFLLNREDATRENLINYREVYKLKPPAHLFIEEPETWEEKEKLYELMDDLSIVGREWLGSPSVESVQEKADVMLSINKKFDMAMSYRFPVLREAMAKRLTHNTGMQNMIIALASSLPANLPVVGIIIGLLAAAGETTVLTFNQLKLCMQLAGLYGLELNLIDRIRELWPLVGTAIGFKVIARGLAGLIPLAGPTIKGSIAYGGTYMVGETVRWYYGQGHKLTPDERRRIYEDARKSAMKMAGEYLEKLKKAAGRHEGYDSMSEEIETLKTNIDEIKTGEENSPADESAESQKLGKKEKRKKQVKEEPSPAQEDSGEEAGN